MSAVPVPRKNIRRRGRRPPLQNPDRDLPRLPAVIRRVQAATAAGRRGGPNQIPGLLPAGHSAGGFGRQFHQSVAETARSAGLARHRTGVPGRTGTFRGAVE